MTDKPSPPRPLEQQRATLRLAADDGGIARAAQLLREGRLVAFPTETVYGLGADATDAAAVAGIFAAKDRPRFNPLISHVADLAAAEALGDFDADARALARALWPGPLTLVVPARAGCGVCDLARAGLDTVAIRVPEHAAAHRLLALVGRPVAAPSANRSGRVSPTTATHVLADLDGRIDAVLDAGPTAVGVESTVVDVGGGRAVLLRPGGVSRAAIEGILRRPLDSPDDTDPERPASPGMLASHYAPRAQVRLQAREVGDGEAYLGFGAAPVRGIAGAVAVANLSVRADLSEAAANLFALMRELDALGAGVIAVAPIPDAGLGEAINDRLARASAAR